MRAGDDLRRTLGVDSFDFLSLLVGLLKGLNVELPESDYGQLTTLSGLVRYLAPRV